MNTLSKLLGLAIGAFAIGTESYVVAGLLPQLAADLGVSVSAAGQLITVFALTYALGAPLLTVATANMERRRLLLVSLATFALFNLLAAAADNYLTLMIARIGLALSAGTFMPAASAYAVAVTPAAHRGRAISIIYAGLTVATVVGAPFGVLLAQRFGWRAPFIGVSVMSLAALAGLALTLKPVRGVVSVSLGERLAIARRPDVLGVLAVTTMTLTGVYGIYAFIAPYLQHSAGLSGTGIAAVLFVFGVGSAVGNLVSGSLSDRIGPRRIIVAVLGTLTVLFALLSVWPTAFSPAVARWLIVPTLLLWGLFGWSFPSAQQARIVSLAPKLAPITLSLNTSAIYLGASLGAFLGSIVVAHRPIADIGWVGALCEMVALAILLLAPKRSRTPRLDEAEPHLEPQPVVASLE